MSSQHVLLDVTSSNENWPDGRLLASLKLDRATLEHLQEHVEKFRKALAVYPDLYEAYIFDSVLEWYESGVHCPHENAEDRRKLAALTGDSDLDDEPVCHECGGPLRINDDLTTNHLNEEGEVDHELDGDHVAVEDEDDEVLRDSDDWVIVDSEKVPGYGNLRTECDQLVVAMNDETSATVRLHYLCYVKHTDTEIRTAQITSADIQKWLAELSPPPAVSQATPPEPDKLIQVTCPRCGREVDSRGGEIQIHGPDPDGKLFICKGAAAAARTNITLD